MKSFHTLFLGSMLSIVLGSCSGISNVIDDDVYVMKSPVLPTDGDISDESTYENYRYQRDKGDFDVHYGSCPSMIWSPVFMGYGNYYSSFGGTYSAFNNPYYYPWPGYGYPYGYNYGMSGYGCNGMYNYGTGPNWQFASYYGYTYYPGPGQNYYYNGKGVNGNNYGNNDPSGKITSYNTHSGPRNSFGGTNNSRRSGSTGMKGMAVKTHNNASYYSSSTRNYDANKRVAHAQGSTPNTRSKPVEAGHGLARPGQDVSTSATPRRGAAVNTGTTHSSRNQSHTRQDADYNTPSRSPGLGGSGNSGSGVSRGSGSTPSAPVSTGRRGG